MDIVECVPADIDSGGATRDRETTSSAAAMTIGMLAITYIARVVGRAHRNRHSFRNTIDGIDVAHLPGAQSGLRSSYRRKLVKSFEETSALDVTIETDFAKQAPELAQLFLGVRERASRHKRVVLSSAFFEAVSGLDEARLLVLRRPDKSIAAYALLFVDGPILRFHCTGFTHGATGGEAVYFRMLYEIVRHGIELGCESIDLGITAADPKMTIGALPVYRHAWIWHRSAVMRRFLEWVTEKFMRPTVLVQRNVFRQTLSVVPDPAFAE